jgi:hypothetical protein
LCARLEKLKKGEPVGFVKKLKIKGSDSDEDYTPANIGENYAENFPSLATDKKGEWIRANNKKMQI